MTATNCTRAKQTTANNRKRALLAQDSAPLRDLYLQGQDEQLWDSILAFLELVKGQLWARASERSYIRKTIGVQALFDVFRYVAQRTAPENLLAELDRVFRAAAPIDFAGQFFQASGKGRVRVKNTILFAASLITEGDLPDADRADYAHIVRTASETGPSA